MIKHIESFLQILIDVIPSGFTTLNTYSNFVLKKSQSNQIAKATQIHPSLLGAPNQFTIEKCQMLETTLVD
jgi:hypothetical protein